MCIKNKIPFIAIDSNTPKIRYLLADALGETNRNIKISELEQINLTQRYEYSDDELMKMNLFIQTSEKMIDDMIAHIVRDVESDHANKYCYK
jgi:hypothetical protein